MKIIIFLILMVCISGQAFAQTNTVSSTSSTVSGTTTVDRTPSTANAPSIVINNQDVCSVASSMAIQSQILGIAGGTTTRDLNCEKIKLFRALRSSGMKIAAVSLLCQDARVFKAMEMSGTPCPYMGLISTDATKAWAENPEKRPDYEEWKKENIKDEEILTDEEATGLGIGSLLFLLFLL